MRKHVIDLLEPSGKGESVEHQVQSGTVTVSAGLVKPVTGQTVVMVEIDLADGWSLDISQNNAMGTATIRMIQE